MFRRDSAGLSAPVAVCSSKTTQNLPKSIKIHQNPYCSRIRKLYPKSRKFRKFKIASVRAEYMRASGPLFCASMASMDSLLVLLQTHSPETTPNPSYPHRFGAKNPKIKPPQQENKGFPYNRIPKIRLFSKFPSVSTELIRASRPVFCTSIMSIDTLLVLLQTDCARIVSIPLRSTHFEARKTEFFAFPAGHVTKI